MSTLMLSAIALGSVVITAFSWRSLKSPRSHGFPRFFAFELLLVLAVLNARKWFVDPLCVRQIISWIMLVGSAFLALYGFYLIRALGKAVAVRADNSLHTFENTTQLIVIGAYRFIRHPLYASLVYLTWGAALKVVSVTSFSLAVCASVLLYATAKIEEGENIERFGQEYRDYIERTKMFIPFVF